jgi:outer membrane protein
MKRLLFSLSLLATALCHPEARAQQARPLSVDEAVQYAIEHKASVKNARLDVLLQHAKNSEVTGTAYPQLSVQDQFSAYPNVLKTFVPAEFMDPGLAGQGQFIAVPFVPRYSNSLTAQASQVLFEPNLFVALQARDALIELAEQNTRLSAQEVAYNVQKAYYTLVIAQRQYGILKTSLQSAREMLHDVQVLRETGFAEKIDQDRTQVQVNNLATDSIRVGSLLVLSEQLLKYQMGMPASERIVLTDTALARNADQALSLLATEADHTKRIEFGLLQSQLRLNEFELKRQKLSSLPTLSLFGNATYTYSANEFNEVFKPANYIFYSMVGASLNVPIFNGFQRRYRMKQAMLNIEKVRNNMEELELGLTLQTDQSRTTLRNSMLELQNQERNLELAASVLDLARKKYKAGVGSNQEVTLAQTDLLQAQNSYFATLLNVVHATTDLKRALGQF